jgi:hypothetical protein
MTHHSATTFQATRFNPNREFCGGEPASEMHRQRQFEICRAIDLISLGNVLEAMVEKGHMKESQARLFKAQAAILQAHLLTENNRSLNF